PPGAADVSAGGAGRLGRGAEGRRRRTGIRLRRQRGTHPGAVADAAAGGPGHRLPGSDHPPELTGGHLRGSGPRPRNPGDGAMTFNRHAVAALYRLEMARALRTLWQSLVTPVITTSLYFVVFGAAIGSRMNQMEGV